MDKIKIQGGRPLNGQIIIGGAKNSALKLMAACLLTEKTLTLTHVPFLADITTMANLLVSMGVSLSVESGVGNSGRVIKFSADNTGSNKIETTAPYEIVRRMRASVVVMGPILARFGHAKVSLPGGCAIGTRPIDLHLMAFEKMGAEIGLHEGYVEARVKDRLKGAVIEFPKVSVGATENALMAATLASGKTILKNAAREPEISDLANCLNKMGAKISGIDSDTLTIEGVDSLSGATHRVMPDRIEAGTFAAAAAITGGEIELIGITPDIMQATNNALIQAGVKISSSGDKMKFAGNKKILPVDLITEPYPGFATDMQAQIMALMTIADGQSNITENIFENRFMHVPELVRMGADITIHGNTAEVRGVKKLLGAEVMATDLRASVSLVLAGLAAEGETVINRVYHIDRGYERVEEKLSACGAVIERIKG